MSKELSFTVKDGPGLNNPVIKLSAPNSDEIVIKGMSWADAGKNKKNLPKKEGMDAHYTEDFELTGVGGKKYLVTREVIIYNPKANFKGGRFQSKIVSVRLQEKIQKSRSVESVVNSILSGTPVREALGVTDSYLNESVRKFNVGDTFSFKDKYGSRHECKVLDRTDFDDMDYSDYSIGTITFSYPTFGSPHKETVKIFKSEQGDTYGDEYFISDTVKTNKGYGIASWVFPDRK